MNNKDNEKPSEELLESLKEVEDWIFQSNGASLSTYLAPQDSRI